MKKHLPLLTQLMLSKGRDKKYCK